LKPRVLSDPPPGDARAAVSVVAFGKHPGDATHRTPDRQGPWRPLVGLPPARGRRSPSRPPRSPM